MKRITHTLLASVLAITASACDKKSKDPAPSQAPPAGSAAEPATGEPTAAGSAGSAAATAEPTTIAEPTTTAEPTEEEVEVPTVADFEEEAETTITAKTLEKELAALEKELAQN